MESEGAAPVQQVVPKSLDPARIEEGQDEVLRPADISDSVQKREKVSPCALELFAGSCKLSKCLKSHGFAAFGIDHHKCKNRVGPCVVMDLTKKSSGKFILTMLSTGKVEAVPMAPPCGTSSRARERPIPRRLRRLGVPEPKQLRSSQYPEGFPWLKGRDYLRVRLANDCYETVSQVFQECHRRGIPCFIENPGNSRMWEVPCIAKLFELEGVMFTKFHACMHGGDRDKLTALLHNVPELERLGIRCDKSHPHRAWSVSRAVGGGWKFDTSAEAEYPMILCSRMAKIFAEVAQKRGWVVHPEARGGNSAKVIPSKWKVASGRQPRGRRSVALLPEDGQVVAMSCTNSADIHKIKSWKGRCPHDISLSNRIFPKGSRLICFQEANNWEDDGASWSDMPGPPWKKARKEDEAQVHDGAHVEVKIGIPMTPEDALRRARMLQHPFDQAIQVSPSIQEAMDFVVNNGFEALHEKRVKTLLWVKSRAKSLEAEEALLSKMAPEVAKVYEDKKFLLRGELLQTIGHEDKALVGELVNGMRITGNANPSYVFPPDFKPAQLEEADLWRVAKFAQTEVQRSVPRHVLGGQVNVAEGVCDMAEVVWDATLKEVAKGWLVGPYSAEEVTRELGPLWTPSRRFGIVQGGKVRNIDDLSEFSVNQAYGTPEKLDLGGVDEVVALSAAWIRALQGRSNSALVGRCLDLKGAYKQIALHRADRPNAVLAVLNPTEGKVSFFLTNVLPFGATGAVMAFNRLARALRDLLQKLFLLPVVNYFDDYPHVDVAEGAGKSQAIMEEFLDF